MLALLAGCVEPADLIATSGTADESPSSDPLVADFPVGTAAFIWSLDSNGVGPVQIELTRTIDNSSLESLLAFRVHPNGTIEDLFRIYDVILPAHGMELIYAGSGDLRLDAPSAAPDQMRVTWRAGFHETDVIRLLVGWTGETSHVTVVVHNATWTTSATGSARSASMADFHGGAHVGSSVGARAHVDESLPIGTAGQESLTVMHWMAADGGDGELRVETPELSERLDLARPIRPSCLGWTSDHARFVHTDEGEVQLDYSGDGRRSQLLLTTLSVPFDLPPLWETYDVEHDEPCSR